jgi:hypothetical protein
MVEIVLSQSEIVEIMAISWDSPIAKSGGNSTIRRVQFGGSDYAVKDYSGRVNGHERLKQEFSALRLVHRALPAHFPEPLGIAVGGLQAVHSWIKGVQPQLDVSTVAKMLILANDLHLLSHSVTLHDALPATDQVLTIQDLLDQIGERAGALVSGSFIVADFIRTNLLPCMQHLPEPDRAIAPPVLTLSLSDFGVHNLLWDEEDQLMRCVDLEFFGWDDAHKLTIDALLHPLADWKSECAEAFLAGAFEIYQLDERRLLDLWPYLNMKWSVITLARAARNIEAGLETARDSLELARSYSSNALDSPKGLSDIVKQAVGS